MTTTTMTTYRVTSENGRQKLVRATSYEHGTRDSLSFIRFHDPFGVALEVRADAVVSIERVDESSLVVRREDVGTYAALTVHLYLKVNDGARYQFSVSGKDGEPEYKNLELTASAIGRSDGRLASAAGYQEFTSDSVLQEVIRRLDVHSDDVLWRVAGVER
jgi:hypothetical protein